MKYILGVLGIVVLVFVVVLLVLRGGNDSTSTQSPGPAKLSSFVDQNSTVSITTIGRLVGDESHRSIRVSVSKNERRLEILSGYDQRVISSATHSNTRSGYEAFLSALQSHGFLSSKKSSLDPRGVCPTGKRYVYELTVNSSQQSNLWNNSCNDLGTFTGQGRTIRALFQQQIPDYDKQVESVKL